MNRVEMSSQNAAIVKMRRKSFSVMPIPKDGSVAYAVAKVVTM